MCVKMEKLTNELNAANITYFIIHYVIFLTLGELSVLAEYSISLRRHNY